ncbi:MAG: TonB-dependent receptor [Pseudomonadota bacterium]
MRHPSKLLLSTAVAALAGLSSPAFAQIDEIIVTAEKRSESVQDVSASITALDGALLDANGITDVTRLELVVPGVNFAFIGNDAKFNVRGANSNNTFNDAASIVGAFVDGVYKTRASQQTRSFYDVNRVEFLKGPQGTLYGRNTLAGALNVITNTPDFSEPYGGANFSAESFSTFRTEGYANIPVSDTLAFRISGFTEQTEGYVSNIAGPNLGGADEYAYRFQALWEPTENASFLLRASRANEEGSSLGVFSYAGLCRPVNSAGRTDQTGSILDCENPRRGSAGATRFDVLGPYTVEHDFVPDGDVREDVVSLEANFDFGGILLKSISSYTDYRNFIGFDGDSSGTNFERFWNDERNESYTQELQLSSDTSGPLSWLAGFYYSKDDQFFSFLDFRATVDNNNNPNGATAIVSEDILLNGFFADSTFLETDTIGVFGQVEYAVSDQLRLIGGLRYNEEDKTLDGGGSNFTANGPVTLVPGLVLTPNVVPDDPFQVFQINRNAPGAVVLEESFDKVTWKVAAEYDIDGDTMAYATVSTGFLSGQLNRNGNITDQQESTNYEIGLKTQMLDNTLQFNISGYYTEYDNLLTQSQTVDPNTGNVITFGENGGDITAFGIEADFVYQPDDRLVLNGGFSFLDSEYGTFGTGNVLQDLNGVPTGFIDLSDTETPWSPDITLNLGASYVIFEGDWGRLTPAVNFFYSGAYQASTVIPFSEVARQDSYTKTDLRLTWDSPNEAYSVSIFGENLENEAVNARVNVGGNDFVQSSFLYPRNYGIRLSAEF